MSATSNVSTPASGAPSGGDLASALAAALGNRKSKVSRSGKALQANTVDDENDDEEEWD